MLFINDDNRLDFTCNNNLSKWRIQLIIQPLDRPWKKNWSSPTSPGNPQGIPSESPARHSMGKQGLSNSMALCRALKMHCSRSNSSVEPGKMEESDGRWWKSTIRQTWRRRFPHTRIQNSWVFSWWHGGSTHVFANISGDRRWPTFREPWASMGHQNTTSVWWILI